MVVLDVNLGLSTKKPEIFLLWEFFIWGKEHLQIIAVFVGLGDSEIVSKLGVCVLGTGSIAFFRATERTIALC